MALCEHKHSTDCMLWFVENVKDYSILKKFVENVTVEKLSTESLLDESTSAVMEALLETLVRVLIDEKNFETTTAKWVIKYLDGFAKLILDNLKKLLADSVNGCRIVIVCLEAIGGIRIGRHWSRQNMRFGSGTKL